MTGRPRKTTAEPYAATVDTASELARIVGRNRETILDWAKKELIDRKPRAGSYWTYDVASCVRYDCKQRYEQEAQKKVAAAEKEVERLRKKLEAQGNPTEDMSVLDRLRADKMMLEVEQKKFHLAQLKNDLIPRIYVSAFFEHMCSHIRNSGELLRKHFGEQALQIQHDALDAAEAGLDQMWSSINSDPRHPKNSRYSQPDENQNGKNRNRKPETGSTSTAPD